MKRKRVQRERYHKSTRELECVVRSSIAPIDQWSESCNWTTAVNKVRELFFFFFFFNLDFIFWKYRAVKFGIVFFFLFRVWRSLKILNLEGIWAIYFGICKINYGLKKGLYAILFLDFLLTNFKILRVKWA